MKPERLTDLLVSAVRRDAAGERPHVPEAGRLVWAWFARLSNARTYGMAGPNPISYAEINAFAALHRWPMESRHVDLLGAMDRAWMEEATRRERDGSKPAVKTDQPMTLAMFDAVFGQ